MSVKFVWDFVMCFLFECVCSFLKLLRIYLLCGFGCMHLSWFIFACVFLFCVLCMCGYTQLVFMWGNLGLASEEKRVVSVPLLLPGQVGMVSVAFVAPVMEGTYTSHWRLAHCGCQFGPRVWCSIVVDPANSRSAPVLQKKTLASLY